MKRNRVLMLVMWSCVIILLWGSVAADTITIVADEWCPYNCTPNTAKPGYMIEIAQQAFEKKGHTVEYKTVNWARAIQASRKGKYNAITGAYKEDAPDFIFPSVGMGLSKNSFFVKKGNSWRYNGVESLRNVQVGIINDYSYGEELDALIAESNNFQVIGGDEALSKNIRKLLGGRIDTIIEDPNVFALQAKEIEVSGQIVSAGDTGEGELVYIAFSPAFSTSQTYAEILSNAVKEMRLSGRLLTILSKYGLSDWE